MTSPGYVSNAAAMTQAVNAFSQCAQNATQAMKNLQNTLTETLTQTTYQGDQATAFWNLNSEIQQQMTTASQQISIMSQLVNKSFQNYTSGDSQAQQTLQTLASSAGANSSALTRLAGI
jgi:hypothetical protein